MSEGEIGRERDLRRRNVREEERERERAGERKLDQVLCLSPPSQHPS